MPTHNDRAPVVVMTVDRCGATALPSSDVVECKMSHLAQ